MRIIRFLIVIGVSGSGKTSVGKAHAEDLRWHFYNTNDFHPSENVAKMANGIPLDDSDRTPWLTALHDLILSSLDQYRAGVLACSVLKERYRQQLMNGDDGVQLINLMGIRFISLRNPRSRELMTAKCASLMKKDNLASYQVVLFWRSRRDSNPRSAIKNLRLRRFKLKQVAIASRPVFLNGNQ